MARIDIDTNDSVWLEDLPPYEPRAKLAREIQADVAIIGGGFTGVSTAYHLSKTFTDRKVVLLEARSLANGASGRNGGHVLNCFPGIHPSDPEIYRDFYQVTLEAIDEMEAIIHEHGLAVELLRSGSYEVLTDSARAEQAAKETEERRAAGVPLEFLDEKAVAGRLRLAGAKGATFDPKAGQLNGAAYLRALRPILESRGVEIFENTTVSSIREGGTIELETDGGRVRAGSVVLATNGYTPALGYFRSGIVPVHSHVVATDAVGLEVWRRLGWSAPSCFADDMDRISYGNLAPDGRVVFGGGSNAAYAYLFGGRTSMASVPHQGFGAISATMGRYLPGTADLPITHRWTGTLAISLSRSCTIGVRGAHRNVYFALGYSGNGVTMANLAGRILSEVYAGNDERWRKLPFFQRQLAWLPPEPFRWLGYQAITKMTGRSPRRYASV